MVSKHENYRVENSNDHSLHCVLRSHGPDAHSVVFRTLLEHLPIAGTPLFWVPLWYHSTVFSIMNLSLVSMLKLNS